MRTCLMSLCMALTLPSLAASQGASFTEYGSGCPSAANSTCPSSNPLVSALLAVRRNINPQIALEVVGSTPIVNGFELFTKSSFRQSVTAWILLPDKNGDPDHANPVGTGTLTVDIQPGWYKATFKTPVIVGKATRFFISWDPGTGKTPMVEDPNPTIGLFGNYMERQLVNNQLKWVVPRALRRWAWKINCNSSSQTPRMTSMLLPSVGNTKFEMLARRAPANTAAIAIIGDSSTKWGSVNLPLDLSGIGAKGCSLLTSVLAIGGTSTNQYGQGGLPVPIPNLKALHGVKFYAQWIVVDPSANPLKLIFSNGAVAVIGDEE